MPTRSGTGEFYAEFAQYLIVEARRLYADEELAVDLDASVCALDSTTIDLCLSMFPWARFRKRKGAVKMHTLLNLRGSIPEFILISDGKMHDVNVLDYLVPLPGAYYLMDRGYLDFQRLYEINTCKAFFVTRAKDNFKFKRRYSRPVNRTTGLICDQTVILTTFYPAKAYPEPLRRIKFRDPEDPTSLLIFLTNDFSLPAMTITKLYKARWMIELFFKWIKTASPYQSIPWHHHQRREGSDMDRHLHVPACGHSEKNNNDRLIYSPSLMHATSATQVYPVGAGTSIGNPENQDEHKKWLESGSRMLAVTDLGGVPMGIHAPRLCSPHLQHPETCP